MQMFFHERRFMALTHRRSVQRRKSISLSRYFYFACVVAPENCCFAALFPLIISFCFPACCLRRQGLKQFFHDLSAEIKARAVHTLCSSGAEKVDYKDALLVSGFVQRLLESNMGAALFN